MQHQQQQPLQIFNMFFFKKKVDERNSRKQKTNAQSYQDV